MKTEVCIIGAGFAGIGAGVAAREHGKKAIIFEATNRWGGLCDNFIVDGFRFDHAVHLSFTENCFCQDLFLSTPHYEHAPEAMNYYQDNWVRHPVQNNLRFLPVLERINVIKGFFERPKKIPETISNYREWLVTQFGEYFAETFPARYTRKYWGTEAENLSCNWCGNRIHQPTIDEVLLGAFSDAPVPENVYYAKKMKYPHEGGYRQFLAKTVVDMDIRYRYRVIGIDVNKKIAFFENGDKCYYDELVSTIPLPELVDMVGLDSEARKTADSLQTTSMALISVGFRKRIDFPSLWFYVYDEDIPFARAYSPSMKSPANTPEMCSSLQFEIYYSREMPLEYSDDELVEAVLSSMERMGLASRCDIAVLDCRHVKYANVIFFFGMERTRDILWREIRRKGIYSCGRFGKWDYLWSDQSFLSGYNFSRL